ncbi:MAG: hypothetical protein R2827_00245 [Bdellovibrionales bacterium]
MNNYLLSADVGFGLLAFFSIVWISYGFYLGRKANDLDGFMLAGRNVGLALGSATAMATWVTSNTIMLAPKFALQLGVWGMVAYSTASFGLFLFAPMAKRIHQLIPKGYTSGDFIRVRYGNFTWILFLIISMVYSMAWLVSMGMAGGIVLEALSGIDYQIGMSVILISCVVYTIFGGLYAVIGTDFIQSIIILIGVVTIGVVVLNQTDVSSIYQKIEFERPELLKVFMPVALISLFNNMFFGFGEVFHNNVWWSRAYAMRESVAKKAFGLSGLLWLPIPIAAGFIGILAIATDVNIVDPDMTGPLVAASILGETGAIFIFVIVFCSLASSIDSLLAATSDLLTEDVYKKLINPSVTNETLRKFNVYIILGLGAVTWVFCFARLSGLIQVLFLSGPLVASLIFPIVCGLYWKNLNKKIINVAILSGSLVGLWCYFNLGWFTASLASAAVSFAITMISAKISPDTINWEEFKRI